MGLQGTKERRCWPSKPQDPTSALSVTIFAALQSSMPVALTLKKKYITSQSFRDRIWKVCKPSPSGRLILPTSLNSLGCCSHLTFLLGR